MRNAYSFDHFPATNTHSYEYFPILYRTFFNRWLESLGEACNTSSPIYLFLLNRTESSCNPLLANAIILPYNFPGAN